MNLLFMLSFCTQSIVGALMSFSAAYLCYSYMKVNSGLGATHCISDVTRVTALYDTGKIP